MWEKASAVYDRKFKWSPCWLRLRSVCQDDCHLPPRQEVDPPRKKIYPQCDIWQGYNSCSIIYWWKLWICKYLPWSMVVNTRRVLVLKALGWVAIQRRTQMKGNIISASAKLQYEHEWSVRYKTRHDSILHQECKNASNIMRWPHMEQATTSWWQLNEISSHLNVACSYDCEWQYEQKWSVRYIATRWNNSILCHQECKNASDVIMKLTAHPQVHDSQWNNNVMPPKPMWERILRTTIWCIRW